MIDPATYVRDNHGQLEDFWRRDVSTASHTITLQAYGYPLIFKTNQRRLLEVADYAQNRYSNMPRPDAGRSIHITLVQDPEMQATALPPHLPSQIRYMAVDNFLGLSAEPWFYASTNLEHWEGFAQLSTEMVKHPKILSRYILDCFVLNMILRTGWAQLHASCVHKDGKAVLLSARHNTGKSTTAFHLMNGGYSLLSDGMTYAEADQDGILLMGYPVGEIKLRKDVADQYSHLTGHLEPTVVRNEKKLVIDLRTTHPDRVLDQALRPRRSVICLLSRTGAPETSYEKISRQAALDGLWPEALHLDDPAMLEANLRATVGFVKASECYQLMIGTDVAKIVSAVDRL